MLVFALFLPLVGGEGRAPPVVTEEQEEVVVVNTRTDVRLICPVRGHPTPLIEWSKVVSWCGVNLTLYKKQSFGVLLSLFLSHRKLCKFQLPQFPFETRHDWWVYISGWITKKQKGNFEKEQQPFSLFWIFWVSLLLSCCWKNQKSVCICWLLMVFLQFMLLLEFQVLKSLVFTKHHELSLSTAH